MRYFQCLRITTLLPAVALAIFCCTSLYAAERIEDFHSLVKVRPDGQLEVTETITVKAENRRIRRGIYRDFPTRYQDRLGNSYRVDFEVDSVLRDGEGETYTIEPRDNGVRVYIGNANRVLTPGVYTYRLRYRTTRQLGFFGDYDELYWNVTGNGWGFPILKAHGEVHLPPTDQDSNTGSDAGATIPREDIQLAVYTGAQGSTASNATIQYLDTGVVRFETTQPLPPWHGITIAVGFPKGLVAEPSARERLYYLLKDNRALLWAIVAVIIILLYYLWAWNKVGRDPVRGTIIPEYQPPENLSPAACYYVLHMGMGDAAVSAAMIDCAVKGHLNIIQDGEKEYRLERLSPPDAVAQEPQQVLSPGEHRLLSELMGPGETIPITQKSDEHKYYKRFIKARNALREQLKIEYHEKLFHKNTAYWWKGIALSIICILILTLMRPAVFHMLGLLAFVALLSAIFYRLLKAPTQTGRRVMDRIEGFKMYLGTAERDRLERMKSPELTPEVFERFLPYAFALGVGNTWCERFERQLILQHQDPQQAMPTWYHGHHGLGHYGLASIGSGLGSSLTGAISSASTPPGSSSGAGGGGSSGGGGGGGGGGGW